ncbi:MAG: calcium/sodium antiporter [Spirochaetia bacterium]|nr:calcium/sodium antiporter [Spirochaetia bacterium]
MLIYFLFFVGFLFLVKGADILVEGASDIAKRLHVSDLVVGLTIVAFGTSAPELAVNVIASIEGNAGVAFGNIVGSNIANTLLILGVASVIYPIRVQKSTVYREIPFSMLAVLVLYFIANDISIDNLSQNQISRVDGFILICFFSIFLYYVFTLAKSQKPDESEKKQSNILKSIGLVIFGCLGLFYGGNWIVNGAVQIAKISGLSEDIIGLTIVAIGTSLPELAASAAASLKKKSDIAIGNVIGSNVFNIFWVFGISAIIRPLPVAENNNPDILMALFSSFILFILLYFMKEHILRKWHGILFLFIYVVYALYLLGMR